MFCSFFYGCFVALSQYSVISIQQLFSVGTIAVQCSLSLNKRKIDEKIYPQTQTKEHVFLLFYFLFVRFLLLVTETLLKFTSLCFIFFLFSFLVFIEFEGHSSVASTHRERDQKFYIANASPPQEQKQQQNSQSQLQSKPKRSSSGSSNGSNEKPPQLPPRDSSIYSTHDLPTVSIIQYKKIFNFFGFI